MANFETKGSLLSPPCMLIDGLQQPWPPSSALPNLAPRSATKCENQSVYMHYVCPMRWLILNRRGAGGTEQHNNPQSICASWEHNTFAFKDVGLNYWFTLSMMPYSIAPCGSKYRGLEMSFSNFSAVFPVHFERMRICITQMSAVFNAWQHDSMGHRGPQPMPPCTAWL